MTHLSRAILLLSVSLLPATVSAQADSTAPPFPPAGKLVDIGGWRLHLNCTGEARPSRPTVILEAGIGDFSVEWSLVQPGVATFARVCSYDRAGDGWSDMGPHPRTFHQIVYELHTLLDKGGVTPPLILVGHSYGGGLVRLYASTYPADVAGMVLVEAGADNPLRLLPDGKLVHAADLPAVRTIPAVKPVNPLRVSDIPPGALTQMKAGLQEAVARANQPPRNKLPADAQRMRTWATGQLGHVAAAVNPFENEELAALRAERTRTQYSLGDMPLIVLTRGIAEEKGPDGAALEAEHRQDHTVIAGMSRNGKLIVATHSGHHVQLDEPELVINAIREVLAAVRQSTRIEEARFVSLGGLDQWITIRGDDARRPLLLLLHGGPGDVQSPYVSVYAPYERAFVLVQWDQRGAGKTYAKYRDRTPELTLDRVARDGIELAQYLHRRFPRNPIIVLGHSWGTAIGTVMVRTRPELFAAYVGTGQVSSWAESADAQFAFLKSKARETGNAALVAKLDSIGQLDPMNATQYFDATRSLRNFLADSDKAWFKRLGALMTDSSG